ncbi:MAG: hypothetical protein K6E29_00115 [Cyanobacteria bacterium RUI128]|nr:hypothetical protein [Cyanobacteria bacterium RUI128]
MVKFIKTVLRYRTEIKKLKMQMEALKFDIKQMSSIVEKYFPLMKTRDKVQLLILRRCLWTKN